MQLSRLLSLGLVIGFTLSIAACGGKDEKKESGEKKETKKDSGDNGASGGGPKKASEKIVGKWELDSDATVAKLESEAKTDEDKAGLQFAKGFLSSMKMTVELTSDGKMAISMAAGEEAEAKEGTYTVKSEDASSVVISGTVDGKTKDIELKLVDDDTVEFEGNEGPGAMVLRRAK
jgi:hypothetical protein